MNDNDEMPLNEEETRQFLELSRRLGFQLKKRLFTNDFEHIIRKSLIELGKSTWSEHQDFIVFIASIMRPDTYVEIGANHGGTFNRVAPFVKRAVAVEIKDDEGIPSPLKDIIKRDNVETYMQSSERFSRWWKDEINLLFIDADHSHDASLRDFLNLSKYVPADGLIILHDTFPEKVEHTTKEHCETSYKTAWFIRKELHRDFEMVTLPLDYGITIVRRAKTPVMWSDEEPTFGPFTIPTIRLMMEYLIRDIPDFTGKVIRFLSRKLKKH